MEMNRQRGFALVFSMIVLVILTAIVVGSVKTTTSVERAAGAYMDRTMAFQAAEQALSQGKTRLMENADICLGGCSFASSGAVTASTTQTNFGSAGAWSGANKITALLSSGQQGGAEYEILQLSPSALASPASGVSRSDCRPYSVMGRGVGMAGGVVLLQTVVWLCPV
ncbi:PilX N-terminal domain-containing pilus assembly protein [uncultured Azonexus sp.]|uniref:pilus assembly PilX family protein n=1 Tax=uncultured Azonexus sp. TaxID=520307 RepID=UPI0034591E55